MLLVLFSRSLLSRKSVFFCEFLLSFFCKLLFHMLCNTMFASHKPHILFSCNATQETGCITKTFKLLQDWRSRLGREKKTTKLMYARNLQFNFSHKMDNGDERNLLKLKVLLAFLWHYLERTDMMLDANTLVSPKFKTSDEFQHRQVCLVVSWSLFVS